jgi:hypothetical protein
MEEGIREASQRASSIRDSTESERGSERDEKDSMNQRRGDKRMEVSKRDSDVLTHHIHSLAIFLCLRLSRYMYTLCFL